MCFFIALPALGAEPIASSRWRVIDGDTIDIAIRLRLANIDAPKSPQTCQDANGEEWRCGLAATARLNQLVIDEVSCVLHDEDRYGRYISTCASDGLNVQRVLVQEGLAVAEYGDSYREDEKQAQEEKRGMWAGEFQRPRDWRKIRTQSIRGNYFAVLPPLEAAPITSRNWWVIDGNTIDIAMRIRLASIDAPELNQYCHDAQDEEWACGLDATERLIELLVDEISCELHDVDNYGIYIATCASNGLNVQRVLVQEGLVVAEYGETYKADERQAQEEKQGMWAGEFLRPREWRRRTR